MENQNQKSKNDLKEVQNDPDIRPLTEGEQAKVMGGWYDLLDPVGTVPDSVIDHVVDHHHDVDHFYDDGELVYRLSPTDHNVEYIDDTPNIP